MQRIRIIQVQVLHHRTTSWHDWCWKSKESYETSYLFFVGSLSWHWAMTCHIGSQWLVIYHNFFGFLLGVSRILDQTRPLLIVLEHGSPYSLASAEDSCQPSAVSHLRTTALLDWCCKSQGYFLKSSCFERQTPLEVDFRAFWVPSGGILRHQSILAWASGSLFLFGFQRNLFFLL